MANHNEHSPLSNKKQIGRQWKCLLFEHAYKYQQTKTLVINSEFDSYAILNMLNISCLTKAQQAVGYSLVKCSSEEKDYIEKYRGKFMDLMVSYLENQRSSLQSIACANHVYAAYKGFYSAANQMVPRGNGMTVQEALYEFVLDGKQVIQADFTPWPQNSPCAY